MTFEGDCPLNSLIGHTTLANVTETSTLSNLVVQIQTGNNAQTPAQGWINLAEQGIETHILLVNYITVNTESHG